VVYFTGGGAERGELSIMKLAIAQIVLGVFILASLFGFATWVEPGFTHIRIPSAEGGDVITDIFLNPGRNIPMIIWTSVYLLLGLSVLGCGIAQYLKARG